MGIGQSSQASDEPGFSGVAAGGFVRLLVLIGCTAVPDGSVDDDEDDEPLHGKDAAALDAFATPPHPLDGVPATYDQATNMCVTRTALVVTSARRLRRALARRAGISTASNRCSK